MARSPSTGSHGTPDLCSHTVNNLELRNASPAWLSVALQGKRRQSLNFHSWTVVSMEWLPTGDKCNQDPSDGRYYARNGKPPNCS